MEDNDQMLRVEVLGAVCELRPHNPHSSPGIDVREFADLDNGRRVYWKEDRGWSGSVKFSNSPWPVSSGRDLAYETIMVTETEERVDSYVEWALHRLCEMGLEVDPPSVYCAPFRVEHGPQLEAELRRVAQLFDPPTPLRSRSVPSDTTAHATDDRAVSVGTEDDWARLPPWPEPAHASGSRASVSTEDDRARLQVDLPRELIERLDEFCHDQKVTKSAVVHRLLEVHIGDRSL